MGLPHRQRAKAKILLLAAGQRAADAIDQRIEPRKPRQDVLDDRFLGVDAVLDEAHPQVLVDRQAREDLRVPAARSPALRARGETAGCG